MCHKTPIDIHSFIYYFARTLQLITYFLNIGKLSYTVKENIDVNNTMGSMSTLASQTGRRKLYQL